MKQVLNPKVSLVLCLIIILISIIKVESQFITASGIIIFVITIDLLDRFVFKLKPTDSIANQLMNREMLISLAAYLALSKIHPEIDEKVNFLFWGFFILEIFLQFYLVKKFKRQLKFRPMSVYLSNHLLNFNFALVIVYPQFVISLYITFVLIFISNIESILMVYILPFWKDDLYWIGDAVKLKKEYQKYFKK